MDWFHGITQTHTLYDNEDTPSPNQSTTDTNTPSWKELFNIDFILLEGLFIYSKASIYIQNLGRMGYSSIPGVSYITGLAHSVAIVGGTLMRYVFCPDYKPYIAPVGNWVNTVCLLKDSEQSESSNSEAKYYIEEQYDNFTDLEWNDTTPYNEHAKIIFDKACNSASRIYSHEPNAEEIIIWYRNADRSEEVVRVWTSQSSIMPVFEIVPTYSKVEFVYVEYRHPKMSGGGIEIKVQKSLLLVGNELFSAACILHWLNYFTGIDFVFDSEYTVNIIDDNVNSHVLHYGDYIVLEDDAFVIMSPSNDKSEYSSEEDNKS